MGDGGNESVAVTAGIANEPTAFLASFKNGAGPVIAVLAEYDALPGLSQEAGASEHKEIEAGGHGHGCGHNLLGSAAMLAAVAAGEWNSVEQAADQIVTMKETDQPEPELAALYEKRYQMWHQLYPSLKESFRAMGDLR